MDKERTNPPPPEAEFPFLPYLPSAVTPPDGGYDELARLKGARIIQIGTTTPGLVEGGGLVIDYCHQGQLPERLVLAFSELGMWVERGPLPLV